MEALTTADVGEAEEIANEVSVNTNTSACFTSQDAKTLAVELARVTARLRAIEAENERLRAGIPHRTAPFKTTTAGSPPTVARTLVDNLIVGAGPGVDINGLLK